MPDAQRDIYSVSRLTTEVRAILENSLPLLWVEGELSNLSAPRSGHLYFTLKDARSQVRCALFRNRRLLLRELPVDGVQVLVRARISFYEPRGEFQLIVEHLEPAGAGLLQRAFEELKAKLAAEGLFDPARKRPLPAFPRRIGVVTSPSGAALRDILQILARRAPAVPVLIYPVPVQGAEAAPAMVQALRLAAQRRDCDLLILARGGGASEDLVAFNDETLARTIAALELPLISAVGHEIDFTIADFVADRRAPTPSAAAELAVPDAADLLQRVDALATRKLRAQRGGLERGRRRLQAAAHRLQLLHPERRLRQQQQRGDELELRLQRAAQRRLQQAGHRLDALRQRLAARSPRARLARSAECLRDLRHRLCHAARLDLERRGARLQGLARNLHAISPLQTLARGYAIALDAASGALLRDAAAVEVGAAVELRLAHGALQCEVRRKLTEPQAGSRKATRKRPVKKPRAPGKND